jgi:class 3 adenylate cyclase
MTVHNRRPGAFLPGALAGSSRSLPAYTPAVPPSERRLSTVLFLDIVGSTAIASDIGDRRWQELLGRFRRIVRVELKRNGGREVNTQGDSFLATFQEPVRAIRSAVAIAEAVHEVGLEVRLGVHTGEIEFMEGNVAGLAVHIGARVMSLAGPAETLVTSTVRELVVGSGVGFEDFSIHELKGVPGTWQLFAVTQVEGTPVPKPLEAAEGAARIAAVEPAAFLVRRRIGVLAGAVVAVVAIAVILITTLGGGGSKKTSESRSSAGESAAAGTSGTITLLKVDPHTGQILHELRDTFYSEHLPGTLRSVNGALWQYVPDHLVHRDLATGKVLGTVDVGTEEGLSDITFGFGSFWVARPDGVILRLDAISGRQQATVDPGAQVVSLGVDEQALWYLDQHGTLGRVDPLANEIRHKYQVGAHGKVVPLVGSVWICDCDNHRIVQFDPAAQKVVRTVEIAEHGFLIGVDSSRGETMWVLDMEGSTVTPLDPATGSAGQPLGFGGQLHYAQIGFDSIWLAAGANLYKVDLNSKAKTTIPMPPGVSAGGLAIDEQTNSLWVQNCGCPLNG